MELQHTRVLGDDVGGGAIQLVLLQLLIGFDDVGQFVGQIVLRKNEIQSLKVTMVEMGVTIHDDGDDDGDDIANILFP